MVDYFSKFFKIIYITLLEFNKNVFSSFNSKNFKSKSYGITTLSFLINQISYNKKIRNIFIYLYIFKYQNIFNFVLSKDFFFTYLHNIRLNYKVKKTKTYHHVITFNNPVNKLSVFLNFLSGFKSFWLGVRFWVAPVILSILVFIYLSFLKLISLNRLVMKCIILFGLFYWIISGFVFFLKKYQYRYFNSSIQRFWKRSYAIFWMLEFFLFFIFFYVTLMASQEPFFMFDNSQVFKSHLFSWKLFILKIFPSTLLIISSYFLILTVKFSSNSKLDFFVIIVTFLLVYIFLVEFYQFFHVISYYNNLVWKLSEDSLYWYLENDLKRTRINNHFITICLIAKFWHIVFTIIFWLFFILRNLEMNRIRYPVLVANFQNFVFIYILAWIYMFPWFKYVFLKLFNTPYYWFFLNNKRNFVYIFIHDLNLIIINLTTDLYELFNTFFNALFKINLNYDFFYFNHSGSSTSYSQFKKNYIKDCFIKNLS